MGSRQTFDGFDTSHFMKYLLLVFAGLTGVFAGCEQQTNTSVVYSGALMSIMGGDLKATTSLKDLEDLQNLYALGAAEDLKGEIQIFDGKSVNSFVKNHKLEIDTSFDRRAALLVSTQVSEWEKIQIPKDLDTKEAFEKFVATVAKKSGFGEEPFPFRIKGGVKSLDWHVIDWDGSDKVHTHQKHQESGLKGTLENDQVEIIGFYSENHQGVFTHHSTFIHMHFKTENATIAGHVDDLKLNGKAILLLPKSYK